MKGLKKIKIPLLIFFIISSVTTFAQIGVGKLSGKVIDADTKEPLIGANVVILNTALGAATDINGEYFILNVTPGTYDVRVSYVGYAPKTIQEVRIVAGITYELNIELSTDFSLPEIVVESKKFFEEKATNTVTVIDAEQINKLPVRGVENFASLNAGVVVSEGSGGSSGNAVLNVRGGRGGEVLYIVDGVPQNDVFTGNNYSQVANAAVEQIQFQIGGYEAKYGQAQSGIVNVTTKSGSPTYSIYGDVVTSEFTDDYGYNLYTFTLGGPIIPNISNHTFFFSGERGWFKDSDPRAVPLDIKSIGYYSEFKPNNASDVWRFTARTSSSFGKFNLRLGANINERNFRGYEHTYVKHNSMHNPKVERQNNSFSGRLSHNISSNTFWNLNLGYKTYKNEQGDGVWFDNLEAYGDSAMNATLGVTLPANGQRVQADENGIFWQYGRVSNAYYKTDNQSFTADFDITSQVGNNLFEVGAGINYNTVRYYSLGGVATLASDQLRNLPDEEKYGRLLPYSIGFDVTGKNKTDDDNLKYGIWGPQNPLLAYAYLQDRFELEDMVLNLGIRFDYFDTQAKILKDKTLPFAGGSDPFNYDLGDFKTKSTEFHVSPRIGIGFPISENTVFHAQYGKFIQQPPLNIVYSPISHLQFLISDNNWEVITGDVESEITTQYEVGFRQVIGNVAALNISAFYKNTKGLINESPVFFQRTIGGQRLIYFTPSNTDFGTIKGFSLSLDVARVSYFSFSADYTLSFADGTGSSTGSSLVAAFRNLNGEVPKVIAPLDFDQRHTGIINVDFTIPKGELGIFEMFSANILFRFNSGRPYTPLQTQNLLNDYTLWGDTKGYVNSEFGPGNFRIDLKLEKSFAVGNLLLTPYLWIENLLDADNPITVYRATGDPYTSGWLITEEGQKAIANRPNPEDFVNDYMALERNPDNFGIPRLIKLGFRVNFSNLNF